MESAKSSALLRKSTGTELMAPPAKRIKRPKNVVDEESYTDAISEIIARDFFPGLLETEIQQEYLDALESEDAAWISTAGRRLKQVMTPGRLKGRHGTSLQTPLRTLDTPQTFVGDTPISVASDATRPTQTNAPREVDINMSLDKFQSRYTSEDSESFYKLLDKQNQKRVEKNGWMWSANNRLPSKMIQKQKEIETKLLMSRGKLKDDGGKRDRMAIQDIAERPARPDSWKSKPVNGLMFQIESVEDSVETMAQRAQTESRAAPREVVYSNTRMPVALLTQGEPSILQSPSLSAIRDAIASRRRASDLESGFDGNETPRVNGYAFVDDEPDEAPRKSTSMIDLGKVETVKSPFTIKGQSRREDLHRRIVDKNAQTKRASTRVGMTGRADLTPVPKFPSSPRIGSGQLTPAAQRLWSKVGGKASRAESSTFGVQTPHTMRNKSGPGARGIRSGKPAGS
ncbi:hypothetical protein QTJ16_001714 [Diplocarpon rosae]|uniref:Nuclear protein Es2 n=1 Tax=Diplocarpon rosae TaxID=946125 RepID=A0AAD9T348_9HELO|nr:hypothetical protein QTJ16_001714 [Diplocarpon rosae]PBP15911.1 nuclear protein Es2 [Diplocarpon rosae]